MDFREASSRLTDCDTLGDIAEMLGVAENTVLRARMDPTSPNARTPPPGWEKAIARLSRKRARVLLKLVEDLER